ncbi:MAG: hypothetical protein LBB77_11820, partial [Treponema sp.]|nr:hypothetical protein [Treponema sp.]
MEIMKARRVEALELPRSRGDACREQGAHDDCCAACAAAQAKGPQAGREQYLYFGGYGLPRNRVAVFGAALGLW